MSHFSRNAQDDIIGLVSKFLLDTKIVASFDRVSKLRTLVSQNLGPAAYSWKLSKNKRHLAIKILKTWGKHTALGDQNMYNPWSIGG